MIQNYTVHNHSENFNCFLKDTCQTAFTKAYFRFDLLNEFPVIAFIIIIYDLDYNLPKELALVAPSS